MYFVKTACSATINLQLVLLDRCLLKKRLCYIKHVRRQYRWLNILRASKCLCLVNVRHVQLSLSQLHSETLETPVTQEKFQSLRYWTPTCRRKRFLWFHHCQYVSRSVGKALFPKAAHRIFLKLVMNLGCLKGKNRSSRIFGKKSQFGDKI